MQEQKLNKILADIKANLEATVATYQEFMALIETEHDAIKTSDLDLVEQISHEKMAVGSKLEQLVEGLRNAGTQVEMYFDLEEPDTARLATVSDLINRLESLAPDGDAIAKKAISGLKETLTDLIELKLETKTKIEVNKQILTKVLYNTQENYRFWQEVVTETLAPYDDHGKQKSNKGTSILSVKA